MKGTILRQIRILLIIFWFTGFDEKFKVGILSGTVDAHHLRLKKNALDKFGLPVTVEEGG